MSLPEPRKEKADSPPRCAQQLFTVPAPGHAESLNTAQAGRVTDEDRANPERAALITHRLAEDMTAKEQSKQHPNHKPKKASGPLLLFP